jgi:hypothetical protein
MSVYNISFKDYLPDSAFRSIVVSSTNNNVQIVNFIKNKSTTPNISTYNQRTTTFKSNSSKPKSYTENIDKIVYNIDSLKFKKNNADSFLELGESQSVCLSSDDSCNICEDKIADPIPCQLEVIFSPKLNPTQLNYEEIINNEWIIINPENNPVMVSNQSISFTVNSFEENRQFNIDVYIKTKFCKEKIYNFSGTDSYSDTFNIPEFDEDDFVIEFLFKISSNDCHLQISYIDEEQEATCITTTTPTETTFPTYPTETTFPTYPTETPTPPVECYVVGFGTGWFTAGGQADLVALLEAAGYTNAIFSPREPYLGSGLPFTDGCGQTFYAVSASCCGTTIGCDPVFTSGFVSGIAGTGNQNPPCGEATSDESFIETCCENP